MGVIVVGVIVVPLIIQHGSILLHSIHNSGNNKLLVWSVLTVILELGLLLIGSIIALLICIDIVFSTKITEKVVAGLITNILWSFIQFIGKIFVKWYEVTTVGIVSLIKIVQRK